MSTTPNPDTAPQGKMDLPQIPYNAISNYAEQLRNSSVFKPQTKPGSLDAGNGNIYQVTDGQYPEVNLRNFLVLPFDVNFPASIDEFAFDDVAQGLAEHLQHAVNTADLDYDKAEYSVRSLTADEFKETFPDVRPPVNTLSKEKIKAVVLHRSSDGQQKTECVLYLRPENTNSLPGDHKVYPKATTTITDKQNPQVIADLFSSYVLSGFPFPKRN